MMDRTGLFRYLSRFVVCSVLSVTLLSSACAPISKTTSEALTIDGQQVDSVHRVAAGLHPAREVWLDSNDPLALVFGWNEATIKAREAETATCTTFPGPGCHECTFCVLACDGTSRDTALAVAFARPFAILEENVSGTEAEAARIVNIQDGCIRGSTPSVTAKDNADYTLTHKILAPDENGASNSIQLKTRVLSSPTPFALDLELFEDPGEPLVLKYKGQVKITEGKLDVNFSQSLTITNIKVFLGKGDDDDVMQSESELVQPSRIVWAVYTRGPLKDVDDFFCYFDPTTYANPNTLGVAFNLSSCRRDSAGNERRPELVTPTNASTDPDLTRIITWFVEYKLEAGRTTMPTFGSGEFPRLEFTIQ